MKNKSDLSHKARCVLALLTPVFAGAIIAATPDWLPAGCKPDDGASHQSLMEALQAAR